MADLEQRKYRDLLSLSKRLVRADREWRKACPDKFVQTNTRRMQAIRDFRDEVIAAPHHYYDLLSLAKKIVNIARRAESAGERKTLDRIRR